MIWRGREIERERRSRSTNRYRGTYRWRCRFVSRGIGTDTQPDSAWTCGRSCPSIFAPVVCNHLCNNTTSMTLSMTLSCALSAVAFQRQPLIHNWLEQEPRFPAGLGIIVFSVPAVHAGACECLISLPIVTNSRRLHCDWGGIDVFAVPSVLIRLVCSRSPLLNDALFVAHIYQMCIYTSYLYVHGHRRHVPLLLDL